MSTSIFFRMLGMYLHYFEYLNDPNFSKFSEPQPIFYDQTEKSQFSNIAGLAIADYLAKQIDGVKFTINYDAYNKINGITKRSKKPDLLAIFPCNKIATIEAKGFSRFDLNQNSINKAKQQAQSANTSEAIACISYGLYCKPKCHYEKMTTTNFDVTQDEITLHGIINSISAYYAGFSKILTITETETDNKILEVEEDENYNYVGIAESYLNGLSHYSGDIFSRIPRIQVIIHKNIKGISGRVENIDLFKRIDFKRIDEENMYIDTDGIGLKIINTI